MQFPFLVDTSGKRSASLTLSATAFLLVSLWFLLSFLSFGIGSWKVKEFSETAAMSYLIPCMALYFGRRVADKRTEQTKDKTDEGPQKELER